MVVVSCGYEGLFKTGVPTTGELMNGALDTGTPMVDWIGVPMQPTQPVQPVQPWCFENRFKPKIPLPWQLLPWQEEPWQDEPWQLLPWQDEPWQDEPWKMLKLLPWQDEPWQDEPWQEEPWKMLPWQDEPWQEEPWQDDPLHECPKKPIPLPRAAASGDVETAIMRTILYMRYSLVKTQ